jgi:excisionase family DNA binding protein
MRRTQTRVTQTKRTQTKRTGRTKIVPAAEKPSDRPRRGEYLTPTEVADRLLVAVVTVRLWATKGLLPSVTTLGGHRRFRAQDVDAFAARYQQVKPAPRESPPRVLIIDDDLQFSRYLTRLIATKAAGVIVEVANDGFSAGVKCASMRPDIVTLDLQMADMDGFEVCSMLRSMFGKTKPRIVALTGFASAGNVERILAAGADSCVAKTAATERLLQEMGLPRALKN